MRSRGGRVDKGAATAAQFAMTLRAFAHAVRASRLTAWAKSRAAVAKLISGGRRFAHPTALHAQHRRPLQPSATQIVERVVCPRERITHDLRLESALKRNC